LAMAPPIPSLPQQKRITDLILIRNTFSSRRDCFKVLSGKYVTSLANDWQPIANQRKTSQITWATPWFRQKIAVIAGSLLSAHHPLDEWSAGRLISCDHRQLRLHALQPSSGREVRGYLWGLDRDAKRLCKIKVQGGQE